VTGGLATLFVLALVLLAFLVAPERVHLSLTAQMNGEGRLVVTEVMPAGLGYDAGIRVGDEVTEYAGGSLRREGVQLIVSNPHSAVVVSRRDGSVRNVRAQNLYWPARIGVVLLGIVASVYVITGALLLALRGWDPTVQRAFLFFTSAGVMVSAGLLSGAWGGPALVLLLICSVFMTGLSLVLLMLDFPRHLREPGSVITWLKRVLRATAVVLVVWSAVGLVVWHEGYQMVRLGTGLYLLASLILAVNAAIWRYLRTDSPVQRLQFRIAGSSVLLGIGPTILLLLLPFLLFQQVHFIPLEIAVACLSFIPLGMAIAFLQPGMPRLQQRLHLLLVPATAVASGFVMVTSVAYLARGLIAPLTAHEAFWPSLLGGVAAIMLLAGYVAAGWLNQLFQIRGIGYTHVLVDPAARPDSREEAARLQERLHLLAQLHDGPVQTATRLALYLGQEPGLSPEVTEEAKQLVAEMRQLIRLGTLAPVSPEEWIATLQEVAEEIERVYGIAVPILVQGESSLQAPAEVVNALFFVAREALYNAARHARATECVVTISVNEDMVQLQVRDNGVGFDPHSVEAIRRARFGLQSMRSRVEALGGSFTIISSRDGGTAIRAAIPFPLASGS